MSSFVSKQAVRIEIDERPGEWVEIKAKLSVGARGKLTDNIMSVKGGKGGNEADVDFHAGRYLAATLEASIVDWHLFDEDGKEVPFKRDLIAELDPDDALIDKVLAEINERNPTLGGKKEPDGSES